MNLDPPAEFDPGEALALFAEPGSERYGLSDWTFFYLVVTCKAVEAFSEPAFTIDAVFGPPGFTPAGAFVAFVIREHVFFIDTHTLRVKLWTASADDADGLRNKYLVFDGDSSDPKAWEGLLKEIGRVEKFGVFVNHADRLRLMWTQWLAERQRRDDERGW